MANFTLTLADIFERRIEAKRFESTEAEREAIEKAKAGDESATLALLVAYAPALRNALGEYRYAGGVWSEGPWWDHAREDLTSLVLLGFMEALHAFDPEVHDRLAAVVVQHVRNSLSEGLSPLTAGYKVPARSLKRFYSILRKADGNVYEAAALAPSFEMKTETFLSILSAVRDFDSLDHSTGDDGAEDDGWGRAEVAHPVYSEEEIVEDRILVEAAFAAVDDLEAGVCRDYYGFSEYDTMSDAEIAHRRGLSRPKVQRVRSSALGKMRSALGVA